MPNVIAGIAIALLRGATCRMEAIRNLMSAVSCPPFPLRASPIPAACHPAGIFPIFAALQTYIMENFSHFIITRFNLNLYAQDKHDLPTRTERWLEHRFEVFERYCLPSVAAQTSKNFTWLCLFDAATPEAYRRRIGAYRAVCPQFEPVFYDARQTERMAESLRGTIADCLASGAGERKSPPRNC